MAHQNAILVLEAPIGSALYQQALALREAVLRSPEGGVLQLKQMAVREERRLEGIGAALVARAEAWARESGIREMVLHARIGAENFYGRLGYRAEGPVFEENTIPHVRMRKRLG